MHLPRLGRPFAIRQMVAQGQNVLLMRDLTDSIYNHRKPAYVSHFRGTELVVEHIEQYRCPSITSGVARASSYARTFVEHLVLMGFGFSAFSSDWWGGRGDRPDL